MVVWRDAYTNLIDESELPTSSTFGKTVICYDVGFFIRETATDLVLGLGACVDDDTVRHSNTIPKSMILDIIDFGVITWEQSLTTTRKKRTKSSRGSSPTSDPTTPSTSPNSETPHPQKQLKPSPD